MTASCQTCEGCIINNFIALNIVIKIRSTYCMRNWIEWRVRHSYLYVTCDICSSIISIIELNSCHLSVSVIIQNRSVSACEHLSMVMTLWTYVLNDYLPNRVNFWFFGIKYYILYKMNQLIPISNLLDLIFCAILVVKNTFSLWHVAQCIHVTCR